MWKPFRQERETLATCVSNTELAIETAVNYLMAIAVLVAGIFFMVALGHLGGN
jgi:hypothetical protein